MYAWNLENERLEAEAYLKGARRDFTATFMKVANLQFIIEQQPEILRSSTVAALCAVLEGTEHNRQRQAFFLFKKAADALAAVICHAPANEVADEARQALTQILCRHNGHPFRAAAEAMGALPINGPTPLDKFSDPADPVILTFHTVEDIIGGVAPKAMQWMGRNLIITPPKANGRVLVLKFARPGQSISDLTLETRWMRYLATLKLPPEYQFEIPEPMNCPQIVVYRFQESALTISPPEIDEKRHAIAFIAPKAYFQYPNHSSGKRMPEKSACQAIICKNAKIFGHLAAQGIIHTAPIPLFHNRIQRHRREDHGLYEWRRGGRLDQWLASCRFPNIGASGIRDFEHFIAFDGTSRRLYDHIGAHVFSLVLIAGSYFRNLDEARVGMDSEGNPIDTRDLFDQSWLARILAEVFDNYYQGFTGCCYENPYPCDLEHLSCRLVEEMGVDRHMEEILRVAEQKAMSRAQFHEFLNARGFSPEQIAAIQKGEQDIALQTGPHLGGFNARISVPELTEYTAALAALCIMNRHCRKI